MSGWAPLLAWSRLRRLIPQLVDHYFDSLCLIIVFVLHGLVFHRGQLQKLSTSLLQVVNLISEGLCELKVLHSNCLVLLSQQLPHFLRSFLVHLRVVGHRVGLPHWGLHVLLLMGPGGHLLSRCPLADLSGGRVARPDAVEGDQTNLIALVELVVVALVEDQLQKCSVHIDVHGL